MPKKKGLPQKKRRSAECRQTVAEQSRLERQIAQRYYQGISQAEIAEELNIEQPTVSRYLAKTREKWSKENVKKIDEMKQNELFKIDILELEYWAAWKRSCLNAEWETTKAILDGKNKKKDMTTPNRFEKQKTTEGQCGDPRFLEGIQSCIKQRCKILGVEAPEKKDITSDGKPIELLSKSNEELDREFLDFLRSTPKKAPK